MKYTNAEIRGAILKAADTFVRKPHLLNFSNASVPDCNTPGCALGVIGLHLGIRSGTAVCRVSVDAGFRPNIGNGFEPFYERMDALCSNGKWKTDAASMAKTLHAYADKYFPTEKSEQLDPAYLTFKASFTRSVEAA